MNGSAKFSECGRYRYLLTRKWPVLGVDRLLTVVMLNPSTADAEANDPTIRRVISFAQRDGYSRIRVLNLFALRSTDPAELWRQDSVGPESDRILTAVLGVAAAFDEPVLAAWGASQWSRRRAPEVLALEPKTRWVCLGTTKDGSPRHPLYVRGDQPMVPFEVAAQRGGGA